MLIVSAPVYLSTTLLPLTVPSPIVPGPVMVAVTDSAAVVLPDTFFSVRVIVDAAAAVVETVDTAEAADGSVSVE